MTFGVTPGSQAETKETHFLAGKSLEMGHLGTGQEWAHILFREAGMTQAFRNCKPDVWIKP